MKKTGTLSKWEVLILLGFWLVYGVIAIWGRGEYWNSIGRANTFMFFVSFPLAFFTNAFGWIPKYFNPEKWLLYAVLPVLFYFGLETVRACMLIAETSVQGVGFTKRFQDYFLGQNEVFIPVFMGFILSFAYISARNWWHTMKIAEPIKPVMPFESLALLTTTENKEIVTTTRSAFSGNADFFFVNTGNSRKRIFWKDILFVQGEGNYVNYVTGAEKILVRTSMKEVAGLLPPGQFVQIHRSYIVALQWIEKVEDNHVFIAGERMAISATFREGFFQRIDGWMCEQIRKSENTRNRATFRPCFWCNCVKKAVFHHIF